MKLKHLIYTFAVLICAASCKKFVEADAPGNSVNALNVYDDPTTAASVLTGIYGSISANTFFISPGLNSLSLFAGMSSDEFELHPSISFPVQSRYYKNDLQSDVAGYEIWNNTYPLIYKANAAIEGVTKSTALPSNAKNQLLGEAKFIRAFCYFYLVNLYGNVPLVLTTDATMNSILPNTEQSQVWEQIISDLKEAQALLTANYVSSNNLTESTQRTRPNKWAATALLARSYLYTQDWTRAESESGRILQNSLYDTVDLDNVFLNDSKEAIWQLQPVRLDENTQDARLFVLSAPGSFSILRPVYLSTTLLSQFEPDDLRKKHWVDSTVKSGKTYHFPYKYKIWEYGLPVTEYQTVFRVSEMYLIRAEARAQQNKIVESQQDLNVVRTRAGLPNTTANAKDALLAALIKERNVEFFSEWGHRWFDLKRTGKIDAAMTAAAQYKNITWETTDQLFPLPLTDLNRNRNLKQNLGY